MWGEELGDSGNVVGRHGALAGHDRFLLFRDIELIDPAEDFHTFLRYPDSVFFHVTD